METGLMDNKLERLRELTEKLTGGSYLELQIHEWEYILDAIPECICIIDLNKNIKFINKVLQLRLSIGSKREAYVETYSSLLNTKGAFCTDMVDNGIIKWCNGSDIFFLSKLNGKFKEFTAPIYSKIGKLLGYLCVLWEIKK